MAEDQLLLFLLVLVGCWNAFVSYWALGLWVIVIAAMVEPMSVTEHRETCPPKPSFF
jgi:hypothetical protein